MQPIGYLKNFFLMAAVVVLSAGCGGGGSDEGAGGDAGFTNNLSGTWTGSVTSAGGTSQPITVGINQPVAGSVASIRHVPLSINGTVSAGGGSFPMTGTKDGNNVTMQFSFGITYTLTGGLSSANSMSGNFTTSSSEVTGGTWLLTR